MAGRPKEHDDRITTSVRFPRELNARLRDAAKQRSVGVTLLVNQAVEDFLDRLIPVEDMRWTRPPGAAWKEGEGTDVSR